MFLIVLTLNAQGCLISQHSFLARIWQVRGNQRTRRKPMWAEQLVKKKKKKFKMTDYHWLYSANVLYDTACQRPVFKYNWKTFYCYGVIQNIWCRKVNRKCKNTGQHPHSYTHYIHTRYSRWNRHPIRTRGLETKQKSIKSVELTSCGMYTLVTVKALPSCSFKHNIEHNFHGMTRTANLHGGGRVALLMLDIFA